LATLTTIWKENPKIFKAPLQFDSPKSYIQSYFSENVSIYVFGWDKLSISYWHGGGSSGEAISPP